MFKKLAHIISTVYGFSFCVNQASNSDFLINATEPDKGMNHRYIQPGKSQHNGKVERSHLTDIREFYQLLKYTDDADLGKKLKQWEDFYNFNRPHGAFKGKTPYEELMCHLKN